METFRIHGDNIIECERIVNIIINHLNPDSVKYDLVSPSSLGVEIFATWNGQKISWKLILLPGFNKNSKKRWSSNIFASLRAAGSYFDETPDAIISKVDNKTELIVLGIEFCSALQAGNQAWQRSARAFSTGRTGCPYLYIVDFVKYELENTTRSRKNLRFPNAAVPYSYVNYSKMTGNFVAQLYVKSEEFDKNRDDAISDFDDDNFGTDILGEYIVKTMLGLDVSKEREIILDKNMNVVKFLSGLSNKNKNFTSAEWEDLFKEDSFDVADYCVAHSRFGFHKTIAGKSAHGNILDLVKLTDDLGIGFASKDLPFGIIKSADMQTFAQKLAVIYPDFKKDIIDSISKSKKNTVVAIFKGFKPRGDDNRPDRGLLPLVSMLSNNTSIISVIYGPLIKDNLDLLDKNPLLLAKKNGLWRSILSLSDYVINDSPVLSVKQYDANRIYDTSSIKKHYEKLRTKEAVEKTELFSPIPVSYGEDDVDSGIHYLFSRVLSASCFEGMCNPPGGDWSGFSVIDGEYEKRWLSLPRVSDIVNGKRPDHIIEFFDVFEKPLLLSIESKEKSADLEVEVGDKLIAYIKELMGFVPSAVRKKGSIDWKWGNAKVDYNNFETISAAAYLKTKAEPKEIVFGKKCELLFVMNPFQKNTKSGWEIEIFPSTDRSQKLKDYIIEKYNATGDNSFILK